MAQISLQRVQALVSDGRAVRVRGRVDLKKKIDDIDFRQARALAFALRGTMRPPSPKHTRYDGSTVEKQPAVIGGFFFAVWGTEYSYAQAAPLVREGKLNDAHFRRVLEQDRDPTIVDVVLAQDTLLGIFRQLRPIGS